uniref:Uncharacterized protein n=1 Tax=Pogona vitticeps TaxID=103695 RepID=A0ABM5F434_9SAUR
MEKSKKVEDYQTNGGEDNQVLLAEMPEAALPNLEGCGDSEMTADIILTCTPSCDQTPSEDVLGAPGAPKPCDGDVAEGNEQGRSEEDVSLQVDQNKPGGRSQFVSDATWDASGDGSGDFLVSLEDPPDGEDRGRGAKADGEQSQWDVPLTATPPTHVFVDETPMEKSKKAENSQTNSGEEDSEGLLLAQMPEAALPNLEGCGHSEMPADIILAGTPSCDQKQGEDILGAPGATGPCDGDVAEGNEQGRSEGDVSLQVDQNEPDGQFIANATWDVCGDGSGDFSLSLEDPPDAEDRGLEAEADGEQSQSNQPLIPAPPTHVFVDETPMEEFKKAENNQTNSGEGDHRSLLLAEMLNAAAPNLEACGTSEYHGLGAQANADFRFQDQLSLRKERELDRFYKFLNQDLDKAVRTEEGLRLRRRREQVLQESPHQRTQFVTQAAEVGPSPGIGQLQRRWKHMKRNRCSIC